MSDNENDGIVNLDAARQKQERAEEFPYGKTLDEMDIPAFLKARDWLEQALSNAGAELNGAGVGAGMVSVSISLEGWKYSVHMRPLPPVEQFRPADQIEQD